MVNFFKSLWNKIFGKKLSLGDGTYTPPDGVTHLVIKMVGGGGGMGYTAKEFSSKGSAGLPGRSDGGTGCYPDPKPVVIEEHYVNSSKSKKKSKKSKKSKKKTKKRSK